MISDSGELRDERMIDEGGTVTVSRMLLVDVVEALNEVPNTPLRVRSWTSTYQLAAVVSRVLREAPRGG